MRSVALDLGVKTISYCEVADGVVVQRANVSALESLQSLLGPEAAPARVAIEACREAWFVHAKLTEWGNDVLLVDTTRSRQLGVGQHRRKTDRIDAEVLARSVERGHIPLAHVLSPHRQELRRQLGVRRALIETRAQYVNTIRGLLRERGTTLRLCDTEHFLSNIRKAALRPEVQEVISPLLSILEVIDGELIQVEPRLEQLCAKEPVVLQLQTTPGVGPVVAACFVSVVDDAKRFRRAHQVESYLGLVPSETSTGGKRRLGSISKQGNSYLRALLVQAAWVILRTPNRNDPLRSWGHAIATRRGKRIATVALARRLAGMLWAMWRDGTVYDPELVARSGARGLRVAAQSIEYQATALERAARKVRKHRTPLSSKVEVTIRNNH